MQLFKAFCMIGRRRIVSIVIYVAVFAMITLCYGMTAKDNMDSVFQSKELSVCVIDEDNTVASKALIAYLDSMHEIVNLENDPEVLQEHLYYRDIQYILTIPKGYEDRLANLDTDDLLSNVKVPGSASGHFVDQQLHQYVQVVKLYVAGGYELEQALDKAIDTFEEKKEVENVSFKKGETQEKETVFYFYQYLPYVFILVLFCGLAPIIITFQKKEIFNRTACAPLKGISRNLQLVSGCGIYSICIWGFFMLLGIVVYREAMFTKNSGLAAVNSLAFLLIGVALTALLSSFHWGDNVMNAINMVANIVGLGMAFIGGVFVPQNMLSEQVLSVARFIPTYWYIRVNNMLAGFSVEAFDSEIYWTSIGIQLLFAAAAFALVLVITRLNRQKA